MTAFDYLKQLLVEAFKTTAQPDANQTLAMHARLNHLASRQQAPIARAPLAIRCLRK